MADANSTPAACGGGTPTFNFTGQSPFAQAANTVGMLVMCIAEGMATGRPALGLTLSQEWHLLHRELSEARSSLEGLVPCDEAEAFFLAYVQAVHVLVTMTSDELDACAGVMLNDLRCMADVPDLGASVAATLEHRFLDWLVCFLERRRAALIGLVALRGSRA